MNKPYTLAQIYARMRNAAIAAGGQTAWAKQIGVSGAYISDVLNAKTPPGPTVLRALNLKRVVYYLSIGDAE